MVRYICGGKAADLVPSDTMIALRMTSGARIAEARGSTGGVGPQGVAAFMELGREARAACERLKPMQGMDRPDIGIFSAGGEDVTDLCAFLDADEGVEFAGKVLVDGVSGEPVLYSGDIFIRFADDCRIADVKDLLDRYAVHLGLFRRLPFARHTYVLRPHKRLGPKVFEMALALLDEPAVTHCHPEVLRRRAPRSVPRAVPRWPRQWHLGDRLVDGVAVHAHAHVERAWEMSRGAGACVAIIDDGIDPVHPDISGPERLLAPFDVTLDLADGSHKLLGEGHGTACAGVACASGVVGATGVAPEARIMPIRMRAPLGSLQEAEAIWRAAASGADVISCSWGAIGGAWDDPMDPRHGRPVLQSDMTAAAIEAATTRGRMGRGALIAWAAGNSNGNVDIDAYPANPAVMAIAACNDTGVRSAYSDYGQAISCAFPSNDTVEALTPGIWTTDRSGRFGYNHGNQSMGDEAGLFNGAFGGTSAACAGVAGTAALLVSANPTLSGKELRAIIEGTADKIDPDGGHWDEAGRSPYYGAGRVNAAEAVADVFSRDVVASV